MSGIPKLLGIMLVDGAGRGPRALGCQASIMFTCSPSCNDQTSGPFLVHSWKTKASNFKENIGRSCNAFKSFGFDTILDLWKNCKDGTNFLYPCIFHSASPHHGKVIKVKPSLLE